MKPIIMDMNEMSDSTEVYESRPNPFFIYFIYFLVAMFVIALVWMSLSRIDIVVKSNGMFKSDAGVYQISSGITGKVASVNVSDGQFVNEGDVLYTLDITSLRDAIKHYQKELANVNARLDILQAYVKYLDGDKKALDQFEENVFYAEILNRKKLLDLNTKAAAGNKIYSYQEKDAVLAEIRTYQSQKGEYENYLKEYDIQENNCSIKADNNGYFYSQQNINAGAYIQEGVCLGVIYPDTQENFSAQIYVENSDIAKLKEGQNVKFEIEAYPSNEYGYFTGTIANIPKDITVDKTTGIAYYVVEASCNDSTLTNKNGDIATLLNGMTCQAKIVVDEENVLEYLLKKIDLLD